MLLLFLLASAFCVYTYALFPLILHFLASKRPHSAAISTAAQVPASDRNGSVALANASQKTETSNGATMVKPAQVSIVIAAHNEAENLPAKIDSLSALTYDESLLQCIFVSDGSTDQTVELLEQACSSHANWRVYHYADAAGKPTALNLGVSHASGEYIVFMDARQRVSPACIEALLSRFSDATVGAVSGELVLADDNGLEASNVGLYWRYEKWIRLNESRLFSTTGATGALYAIRRVDYQLLASDALLDDFDTPISLLKRGKRTVFETEAKVFDQAEASADTEFRRKARTLAGNYQSFARNRWLFHPGLNPVWWQFLSHKVFRLLVPYALLAALIASAAGEGLFLTLMFYLQLGFYGLGLLGSLGVKNKLTTVIKVFLQLNAAAVVGAWRALSGSGAVKWKTT